MYAGGVGVPKDPWKAAEWLRKSAEQGNVLAQFNLGGMYQRGEGVLQSTNLAVSWYRKAAERGLAHAQYAMAVAYAFGWVEQKDDVQAVRWLRKASDQGEPQAQLTMGLRLMEGDGVSKDLTEGYALLQVASQRIRKEPSKGAQSVSPDLAGEFRARKHQLARLASEALDKYKSMLTAEQLVAAEQRATVLAAKSAQ